MSPQDLTYMRSLGVPLTDNERKCAEDIHVSREAIYLANVRKLENELQVQKANLAHAQHMRHTLSDPGWEELGPNSMLQITHQTRRDLTAGITAVEVALDAGEIHLIRPDYLPDETAALLQSTK